MDASSTRRGERTDPILLRILRSHEADVLNQLQLTREVAHAGESGRAREKVLRAFLLRLIPSNFGVGTGFVIDAQDRISKQVDVVVFRTDYAPVLDIGGVQHFLVESVVACIEVKANITSRSRLSDALENIASVKRLDRTNGGRNRVIIGHAQGETLDQDQFYEQVFGAVLTESSLSDEALGSELTDFMERKSKREWPNLYVDVRNLVICYERQDGTRGVDPYRANRLVLSRRGEMDGSSPLLELAFELVNWFRVIPKVDFSPVDYIPIDHVPSCRITLPQ